MKALLLYALTICSIGYAYAQEPFEKGYVVNTAGEKAEFLINVLDLSGINSGRNKIDVKNSDGAPIQSLSVSEVREIAIGTSIKLSKFTVQLDDAKVDDLNNKQPNASYKEKTVFLSTIVEGKASLFSFDSGNGKKFFYSIDKSLPLQLTYRKYVVEAQMVESNLFRQELMRSVRCKDDVPAKFLTLHYTANDLIPIFQSFNECNESPNVLYKEEHKAAGSFMFGVFAGVFNQNVKISEAYGKGDNQSSIGLGVGAELVYLTVTRKWGFVFRAELQQIDVVFSARRSASPMTFTDELVYKTVSGDLSIGIRYYLNPKAKGQFFAEAGAGMNFPFSDMEHNVYQTNGDENTLFDSETFSTLPSVFMNFGVGYSYNKLAFSLRYETNKKAGRYRPFTSSYKV